MLVLIVILVRILFSPPPIHLPPPEAFVPSQPPLSTPLHREAPAPVPPAPYRTPSSADRSSKKGANNLELFEFDPNTLDSTGFLRLGFSSAQTRSLLKYRASGAVFRKPEDFSHSYVVSEQMYNRLASYIRIEQALPPPQEVRQTVRPQPEIIEINSADTARLVQLRGIGPYYARKMVQYRERLGGFVRIEQLLEVEGIDAARLSQFEAQVIIDLARIRKIDLKSADPSALGKHPYIGPYAARWIVHYREQLSDTVCTVSSLLRRNLIKAEQAEWLRYYVE